MKKISGKNYLLVVIASIINLNITPSYSFTILNCSGDIPEKTACIIKATSYKVNISRIDICEENPFPQFRSTPDYTEAKCLNLYNLENNSRTINLDNTSKFYISEINNLSIREGTYNYVSMILDNKFTVSGKYNDGEFTYRTGTKGPKNILVDKNNNGKPFKFSEKLISWRGGKDKDNKYCDGGGTKSRCDLNYNGTKLTVVGLNSNFFETYGDKTKYLFYLSKLSLPIKLNKNSKGFFEINYIKNLEVYGNGNEVKSISIAPFLFNTVFFQN